MLWVGTWLRPVELTAQPTASGIEAISMVSPIVDARNFYSEAQSISWKCGG
jgi:hypothetical protein